jgi:hypothetical protein
VSTSSAIELASGLLTGADRLAVEPVKLTATVAAIIKALGSAQIELAARRAAGL